jgi:type IV pilus assembly protein PilX
MPAGKMGHPSANQQGVALIMALVFLLMLTLLALTAMNTAALEEKMAQNTGDKTVAFQAAESALIAGELWIAGQLNKPVFDPANTSDGLHLRSLTGTPMWDESTGVWSGTDTFAYTGLTGVSAQPRYLIEDLGEITDNKGSLVLPINYKSSGKNLFRITARGRGATDTAVAVVQSVYERRF